MSVGVELAFPSAADSLDLEADGLGVEVFLDVGGRHFGESKAEFWISDND